jgi:acyl-CoA thioester hydrolase
MDTRIHRYPLTVLELHLDTLGHVNNATYLSIFEEARWDLITANGYGLARIQETGMGPVILEINIRFRRELRLRQKVFIETRFLSYAKKLALIKQEIVDDQGQLYCTAEFKFGLFHLHERKLVNPTPAWLAAIGAQSAND